MKRVIAFLIILSMVFVLASFAAAGTVFPANQVSPYKPLLPANYIGASNNLSPDLLDRLVAYWSFNEPLYDGSTGEAVNSAGNGLSVYENRIKDSEDMTQGTWSGTATALTATTAQDDGAGVAEAITAQAGFDPGTMNWTASAYIKKEAAPTFYPALAILSIGGTNKFSGVVIDTANGTIVDRVTGGAWVAPVASSISAETILGVDYWRVSVTWLPNADNTNFQLAFYPSYNTDASGSVNNAAQGTSTAQRFQLSNTSSVLEYVTTTGTAVSSTNNSCRAVNGVTPTDAAGKLGRGLDFVPASSHYLECEDSQDLRMVNGGTIAFWMNPDSVGEGNNGRVVDKANGGGNGYAIITQLTTKLSLTVGNVSSITGNGAITFGAWQLVIAEFTADGRRVWVNNVEQTLTNASDGTLPNDVAGPVYISRFTTSAARFFDGMIDEMGIWGDGRTLSEDERTELYNAGRGIYIQ